MNSFYLIIHTTKQSFNNSNLIKFLMILPLLVFLTGLLVFSFGSIMNSSLVFGGTLEQKELAINEDGKKKAYTDCEGYQQHTEFKGISKEDADFDTDAVDKRIATLQLALGTGTVIPSDEEDVKEELACLQAIRVVDNNPNATIELADSTDSLNYIPYSNSNLGISFEYPSTWSLDEKENRFDTGADVTVGDGLHLFSLIRFDDDFNKQGVDLLGLSGVAEQTKPADHRMIGQVEENKYIVDGEDSASYVSVNDNSIVNSNAAMETIMVLHDETVFLMRYQDMQDKFDTPESQQIINHIMDSFRFIDSENSSISIDDNNGDN